MIVNPLLVVAMNDPSAETANRNDIPFHERYQLTDQEWDLLEILYAFLLPFKRVTTRFESNKQNPEFDYLFFAYDRMFNHIEDVLFSLHTTEVLGTLECAPIFMAVLEKMKEKLQKYYEKTNLAFVYTDAMILNPRCKLSISPKEHSLTSILHYILMNTSVDLKWNTNRREQSPPLPLMD